MRRLLVAPAAVLCAVLALAGCAGGSGTESTDESSETSASTSTPPERPRVGDCHSLTPRDVLGSADTEPAADCADEHTAETVHVGTLGPEAEGKPPALTSDAANRAAGQRCRARAAAYLGTDLQRLRLTRVEVFWFVPTSEELEAGADWLRCDVVVLAGEQSLLPLPRTVKGALAQPAGLERYGLCGTARPGSKGFERVVCSSRHSWQAISTIDVGGGRRYPGTEAVRDAGEEACQGQARAAQDDALQYDYGWEWPTESQWEAGQRHGYCWAPA